MHTGDELRRLGGQGFKLLNTHRLPLNQVQD